MGFINMIIDDVIWEIINNSHCAFKTKTVDNTFCRNQYNITGLCNRNSCPLANSRYATIQEEKGVCYLYMKTAERAHTPKELWEKVKLDKCFRIALEQIDENLMYWPEFLKSKCKERFTRIRQMLVRKRRMRIKNTEEYDIVSRKAEKREKAREKKAEKSSLIERHIEEELLKNLKSGKYEGIFNYPLKNFEKVLNKEEVEVEAEKDEDLDYDFEDDNMFVGDLEEEPEDDEEGDGFDNFDDEDDKFDKKSNSTKASSKKSKGDMVGKKRNKGKINLEYEYEREDLSNNKNTIKSKSKNNNINRNSK